MLKKLIYRVCAVSLIAVTAQGCSTEQMNIQHSQPIALPSHTPVAVVPFHNATQNAGAGIGAATITSSLLRTNTFNVASIALYLEHKNLEPDGNILARCKWARVHSIPYILKGRVNEWGYASTADGNLPVAAFTLQLRETSSCSVVWNATGNKVGHPQMSVEENAQKLIADMLRSMSPSKL